MAHVAQASEGSGRVLLWLEPDRALGREAIGSAVKLAGAFGSEIETLIVDDGELSRAAALPVTRLAGGLRPDMMDIHAASLGLQRLGERQRGEVERQSEAAGVPCHHTITAGDAIDQLTGLCLMSGPWNVIALAGEPGETTSSTIAAIFANVSGATGIVLCGRQRRNPSGPVVVVAEDAARLPSMLRAAGHLSPAGAPISIMLASDTTYDLRELEAHARIAAGSRGDVVFERTSPSFALEGTFDDRLRGLSAGFVVARFGGSLLPPGRALARTIALAGAPFLLVR
jgi:hypothetical protein